MISETRPFDLKLSRTAFATTGGLHAEATRRAASALTPADYDALRALDAAFVAALEAGRVVEAIAADDAFHQVFLDVVGDPDLQVSVDLMAPRLRRMDLWLFTRKAFEASANTHPETIAALEGGDVERAVALVAASFTEAGEALAAVVARGAGAPSGG
jgi:DNA-binding GntR family transcriptional regulator